MGNSRLEGYIHFTEASPDLGALRGRGGRWHCLNYQVDCPFNGSSSDGDLRGNPYSHYHASDNGTAWRA